jgi:site-specific DNA-methyltransferase (adenine-specific)/adenine-specific DNA-methyltransferase
VAGALLDAGFAGKADLVYVDPPFASQASYTQETRLDGPADGRVLRTRAYDDSWPTRKGGATGERGEDGVGAYLDMLAPRLEAMCALLSPTGSIWVHVDWRAAYLVRVLLDEIVGRQRFLNEVVWRRAPNLGRQAASGQFGRTLDTLVVYGGPDARLHPPTRLEPIPLSSIRRDELGRAFTTAPRGDYSDESMARLESEGRVHRTATGRMYVKYFLEPNAEGELCRKRRIDTLWTDVPPLRHAAVSERTGFPTQKPRALLERIIECATPEGGTVVDLFAGSGTTGEAAHVKGRTFVLGDSGPVSVSTTRARLLRAGAPFTVESCGSPVFLACAPPDVGLRQEGGDLRVELALPKEPLAWALGPAPREGEPFVASWHAGRRPGVRPVPAAREHTLAAGDVARVLSASREIEVRAYEDDGSVGSVRKTIPTGLA